jgi:hypothetical protein
MYGDKYSTTTSLTFVSLVIISFFIFSVTVTEGLLSTVRRNKKFKRTNKIKG